ncbi:MAG: hypothetical protein V7727_02135 [Sneathiella sp.]
MGYHHDIGSLGFLISETIQTFSPNEIFRYLGKTVDALRKDANPMTNQRLGYEDAQRLDNLWFDRTGTRPFLQLSKKEAEAHSGKFEEIDRQDTALGISETCGKLSAAVRRHDEDGITTPEELDVEIRELRELIKISSAAEKALLEKKNGEKGNDKKKNIVDFA